ncbi:hypothetical protein AB0A74_00620 [Saccharothrix sp. NPDC042600]|uniref:hypothetical protein n=1 Tax=Saccharothrix TaxID=2071 RepID=UPI0034029753|nr:hypothetical protein GCM10017745_48080 [Saccharothrix mutabilis subsp. capreolus]
MSGELEGSGPEQPEQAANETEPDQAEQSRQEYFEQLAAVQNSIREGVITPW